MNKFKIRLLILFTLLFVFLDPVFAHSQTVIIEMTAVGFKPTEATLDSGSVVIFVNKDTSAHWPASDIHPTHDIYPQFDPQKGIESGATWSFKPSKAGVWKYHDHLKPHLRATLIVEKEPDTSVENISWLENVRVFFLNFQVKIRSLFDKKEDPTLAWNNLKEKYKGQGGSSGNIHDLAHLAGSLIYDQKGFDGITLCTPDFAFGCFHGFLDKAFVKSIDKLQEAHKACLKLDSSLSGSVASCLHGIGHGVASFFSVSDLKKSLSTCRKLESGEQYCFDGVFMEFARNAPESYIKRGDPLYPCDSLEKEFGYAYSSACGRNQPSLLLSRFNMSFEQVIPICLSSASTPFKQSCIDSLGFSLASSGDSEKIIQGCQMMNEVEYINRCTQAAAGELVFQDVPGWDQKSKAVCESLSDNKEACLSYVNKLVLDYKRVRK